MTHLLVGFGLLAKHPELRKAYCGDTLYGSLRTGAGNTWNEARVRLARQYHQLPTFDPSHPGNNMTLREAAQRLNVGLTIVRRMIAEKKLPASQVVACAPWQIPAEALNSDVVRKEVENIKNGVRAPRTQQANGQQALFS